MRHLLITNKGLLEVAALTLLGASSKRGDRSKIGMFGSGNKYALAYFARNGHAIRIVSGGEEIKISLTKTQMRGSEFDVLCINGQPTSITTEFGHKWELWQAVRELYSNAVDEGLIDFKIVDVVPPCAADTTQVIVSCTTEVETLMFNIKDYVCTDKEVLFESAYGQILRKHSTHGRIYYKGILVYEHDGGSVFDYNVNEITLNESREVMYSWHIGEKQWQLLLGCDNPTIIRMVLNGISESKALMEQKVDDSCVSLSTSLLNKPAWNDALESKKIAPWLLSGYVKEDDRPVTWFLPKKLFDALLEFCTNAVAATGFILNTGSTMFINTTPDATQAAVLEEAKKFLTEVQLMPAMPIQVASFLTKDIYGTVKDGQIIIATACLDAGVHTTAVCILEEALHISTGMHDMTRSFQSAIFEAWLNYAKRLNAYVI